MNCCLKPPSLQWFATAANENKQEYTQSWQASSLLTGWEWWPVTVGSRRWALPFSRRAGPTSSGGRHALLGGPCVCGLPLSPGGGDRASTTSLPTQLERALPRCRAQSPEALHPLVFSQSLVAGGSCGQIRWSQTGLLEDMLVWGLCQQSDLMVMWESIRTLIRAQEALQECPNACLPQTGRAIVVQSIMRLAENQKYSSYQKTVVLLSVFFPKQEGPAVSPTWSCLHAASIQDSSDVPWKL